MLKTSSQGAKLHVHYNEADSGQFSPGSPGAGARRLLVSMLVILGLAGCELPVQVSLAPAATPTSTATATPTSIVPTPEPPLGSADNPIIVALPPSTRPEGQVLNAGETLTSLLEKNTGYDFVSVIPPGEAELVQGLAGGHADVASLSPFGYLLASDRGDAEAAFAREQDGRIFYDAEFLAPAAAAYLSYFDPVLDANTAEASVALAQFANKKPCWTDELSPSGYVVPLGILSQAAVGTREPAFLAGHPAVVRALYAGGICDFGATYVGAIDYPGLEDQLPEVRQRLEVIWRIPAIIPYETMVFSTRMPLEMRRLLTRTFVDLMGTPEGRSAIQALYGFNAMQIVRDAQYEELRDVVKATGLELGALLTP